MASDNILLYAFIAFCFWVLFAHPPRNLSPVEYRNWYRNSYLRSVYWRAFSRFRRGIAFGVCAHWYKGKCSGPRHVHHKKWAYRWLFFEWLIWPFGTVVLCERHHKDLHK